jgi:hypothetical protein
VEVGTGLWGIAMKAGGQGVRPENEVSNDFHAHLCVKSESFPQLFVATVDEYNRSLLSLAAFIRAILAGRVLALRFSGGVAACLFLVASERFLCSS